MTPPADLKPTTTDHVIPFCLPPWSGWVVAVVFILATGYFAIANFNTRSQFDPLRVKEQAAVIEAQSLRNLLEAERLISAQQIKALKAAQAENAALHAQLNPRP